MSMFPMMKKCPGCKKKYPWNPDVEKVKCPHCGMPGMLKNEELFQKMKKNKND